MTNATTDIRVLAVIPVYNHGGTLREVALRTLAAGFDLLVVDDGSTDGGLETVRDLDCRIHTLSPNQGKGAAILAGAAIAAKAGYDAILTIDADGQHDPASIPDLVREAKAQWPALVIGSRQMERGGAPGASLFGRSFSNFWVRLETGCSLPDTQSGLRLYPVRELLALPIRCRRYDFEIESLVRLCWAGVQVRSVPVPVHYPTDGRRITHFDLFRDNLRLTLLHTALVARALVPLPHRRLVKKKVPDDRLNPFLHPVRLFKRLLREHATPGQLATAAWMGIFLGALPLIGVHTLAIIYVCHMLHLNKPAAVAASQLCMPPLVPFLCIQAGYFFRHGAFLLDFNRETLVVQIGERLWEYLLGSLVIGPLLGFIVAVLTYVAIRIVRTWKTDTRRETDSLAADQKQA
ncbi:MAG: DUF2062 domain-containing protein [Desulfobulbaceae bacterium]